METNTAAAEAAIWNKVIMKKMAFVQRMKLALTFDDRSNVENITYASADFYEPEFEEVRIKYKGKAQPARINVTGNSLSAICMEIVREVYGMGAHGSFTSVELDALKDI